MLSWFAPGMVQHNDPRQEWAKRMAQQSVIDIDLE